MALAGLGALVLLVVCGLSTFFVVHDDWPGQPGANGPQGPVQKERDISSREVDPAPLTVAEVYPAKEVTVAPGQPPYQVLSAPAPTDCTTAATDDLLKQLTDAGCSQVVRGTLKSPTGEYLITAGVFNLATEAGADGVRDAIKPLIDGQKGRFTGLVAGKGTEALVRSATQLGWDVRGHFLVYCVIARADGKAFQPGDPVAKQIIYDMIVLHLRNNVLDKRAVVLVDADGRPIPASSGPPANPSPTG